MKFSCIMMKKGDWLFLRILWFSEYSLTIIVSKLLEVVSLLLCFLKLLQEREHLLEITNYPFRDWRVSSEWLHQCHLLAIEWREFIKWVKHPSCGLFSIYTCDHKRMHCNFCFSHLRIIIERRRKHFFLFLVKVN